MRSSHAIVHASPVRTVGDQREIAGAINRYALAQAKEWMQDEARQLNASE
jgi:hypothetical protein